MTVRPRKTQIRLNQPFPRATPDREGVFLEIVPHAMVVFLQMPRVSPAELAAFERGVQEYGCVNVALPVPIPLWIFRFKDPIGYAEAGCDARAVDPETLDSFLASEKNGRLRSAAVFYLLDGDILKGAEVLQLDQKAVRLFRQALQAQVSCSYEPADYLLFQQAAFSYDAEEMLSMEGACVIDLERRKGLQ